MSKVVLRVICAVLFTATNAGLLAQSISISGERRVSAKGWEHHLINNHNSAALAFEASYSCSDGGMDKYYDPLIDYGSYGPLKPGASYDVPLTPRLKECKGDVVAAIFADGSTQGEKASVESILSRRRAAYAELLWIEGMLDALPGPNPDFAQVVNAINSRIAVMNKKALSSGDWSGTNAVLHYVAFLLTAKSIPPDTGPSATPLPTVKQLMDKKHYTPVQAYAAVLNERLKQWSDELRMGAQV